MPNRPRWRRGQWVLAGLAAVVGGAALWLAGHLFLPRGPGIPIGPETTRLTGPLTADGYVDYHAALREAGRVPRDRNAAVPITVVLKEEFRETMDPKAFAAVCKDFGLDPAVESPAAYVHWFEANRTDEGNHEPRDLWQVSDYERLVLRPWTAGAWPEAAAYVDANGPAIAELLEAAARPAFWFRPPQKGSLIESVLHMHDHRRTLELLLQAAAMRQIGERRLGEAAATVDAFHRLVRLRNDPDFLISADLPALRSVWTAYEIERVLIAALPTAAAVEARRRAVAGRTFEDRIAEALDGPERFSSLDAWRVVDVAARGRHPDMWVADILDLPAGPPTARMLYARRIDVAEGSRRTNAAFDELAAALRRPRVEWPAAVDRLEDSYGGRSGADHPKAVTLFGLLTAPTGRQLTDDLTATLATSATMVREMIAKLRLADLGKDLTLLACDVRLFELASGRPPQSPDDLAPYNAAWPVDARTGQPLRHEPVPGGWRVYSLGPDGLPYGHEDAMVRDDVEAVFPSWAVEPDE